MRPTRGCLLFFLGAAAAAWGCGSDVDSRPVSWEYIYAAIVVPNCATSGCHSALTKTKTLNFNDKEMARILFSPDTGLDIMGKIEGTGVGLRMPPDQPLPQADIDLIGKWIAAGGPNN